MADIAVTTTNEFYSESKPLKIGSDLHKQRFCQLLLDSFNPYKPSVIAWPNMESDALNRIISLPFWDVAVQTEGYASRRVQAFADTIADPLLKEAVSLNAFEEARHKLVLENMIRFYNIPLAKEPIYTVPKDPEWAFIRTGYGECLDSFFAFGLFKMARDSGYFPPELVEVFEPVIQEESRHILFFVNWAAWTAANKSFFGSLCFRFRCIMALAISGWNRLSVAGMASDGGKSSDNYTVAGRETLTIDLSPRRFLETCLIENERRMAFHDAGLLRPLIMPRLVKLVLVFIRK